MSPQLVAGEVSEIIQRINSELELYMDDREALKVAPALRQLSRDLRATSESLRAKNLEIMNQASAVAVQYYELIFRKL